MKKQRNTTQMKEKTRNTEVQINEEEIGKLPEKVFRMMIVKMIPNIRNRMEAEIKKMEAPIKKIQQIFNKDLKNLKNKQSAMNNTITEIKKNTLEAYTSKITEAEIH